MKKLFFLIQGLFIYPFLALPAFAQTDLDICKSARGIAKTLCDLGGPGGNNVAQTIQNIVVFFVVLSIVIALLYLVYGGLKWITSRGEKDQVEAARNHIIAAIIGLIVVFLAIFILSIVLTAFGLKISELAIPNIVPK